MNKCECVAKILDQSKLCNYLILNFAFLAYSWSFFMFNSSSKGRRAQNALKIFMHLLCHALLMLSNFQYIYTLSHDLSGILLEQFQLGNCRKTWHGMALRLQAVVQTWYNYSSIYITYYRRCMNIFWAFCALLPLLELLNMQKCHK